MKLNLKIKSKNHPKKKKKKEKQRKLQKLIVQCLKNIQWQLEFYF